MLRAPLPRRNRSPATHALCHRCCCILCFLRHRHRCYHCPAAQPHRRRLLPPAAHFLFSSLVVVITCYCNRFQPTFFTRHHNPSPLSLREASLLPAVTIASNHALCRCHRCCHVATPLSPATTLAVPYRITLPPLLLPLPRSRDLFFRWTVPPRIFRWHHPPLPR
ncbi:hypothetical protein B296_00020345 [Ensete ventricosum]|uniref:Uncharacterized protein n=1 Tax=Ensete ventricosum TaxID=4639 RepID=A0A426ZNJ2_ENSVE|nr:hypothetical protein B296_00020345 [Ensete ventricosum]